MATKKNDRCPLQKECGKKCEHIGSELNCDYYKNNGIGDNTIPDQEEIRRALERNEEYDFESAAIDEILNGGEEDDLVEKLRAAYSEPYDEKPARGAIEWIAIERLHGHKDNPRKDLGDLTELSDSIKANGVMQNLTVVKDDEGDAYTIIIGHRRMAAAKLAGLTELPCVVVNLTPQEQIATMLLENMQRSDLTYYEQAQGFQMMLDFGDTVETIAQKTGFSQTTVRRRIKMAELDADTMKKVSDRQITLFEFDKLSQIEDIGKRNEVLKEIGTPNYERAIKNALAEQTRLKNEAEWRGVLASKGLTEISYQDTFGGEYHSTKKNYVSMGTIAASEYELAGDEQYFSFNYNVVYFRRDKSDEDSKKNAEKERADAIKRELRDRINEANTRAFSLRHDFVFGMSETEAKKHAGTLIEFDIRRDWEPRFMGAGYYMRYIHETFADRSLNTRDGYGIIADDVRNAPYRSLLRHIYTRWCDNKNLGFTDWNCSYEDNEQLSLIYDFLKQIGYEMSDEEKELQDGTSTLYAKPNMAEANYDCMAQSDDDPDCDGDCDNCEHFGECATMDDETGDADEDA